VELIIALKESGFFEAQPINVKGQLISPIDFSSQVLFREWKLGEEERELTIMKVLIHGHENGQQKTVEYNLLDRYDNETKISSMSRTTGYTCTASANLIASGLFRERGVFPPELVGKDQACFDFVMHYLVERKVQWNKKVY
jgi:saccharopine dehydrogenase-like NADP-dependent oxidoreductase